MHHMDVTLVQLIKQGDKEAFTILYDQYWKPLLSYAGKRLVMPEDAEEIVQEIFVTLWERRGELDIHSSVSAYLHTSVKYRVYSKYREWLKRNNAWRIPGLEDVDYSVPALDPFVYKELEEKIRIVIGKLPQKCREAFVLSREEKLPNKKIAQRMSISVNTVEKHIGKALQMLRAELKDDLAVILAWVLFAAIG